jgi:hypothetical protein
MVDKNVVASALKEWSHVVREGKMSKDDWLAQLSTRISAEDLRAVKEALTSPIDLRRGIGKR